MFWPVMASHAMALPKIHQPTPLPASPTGNPTCGWKLSIRPPISRFPKSGYPQTIQNSIWLVVSAPLKNINQWEGLSHILWKIKKCSKPPTSHHGDLGIPHSRFRHASHTNVSHMLAGKLIPTSWVDKSAWLSPGGSTWAKLI